MKKISFFILLFLFAVNISAQNPRCSSVAQSITIRGFRLGMSEEDAKKRYPKIKFYKDLDVTGLSNTTLDKVYNFEEIFTEEEKEGLSRILLSFFDKKLSEINTIYDGFTKWDSLEEFTDASAKVLNLPLSSDWQKLGKNSLRLNCRDFYVISKLDTNIGRYELQNPKLFLSLNDFKDKLEARKNNQKEEQKKVFKP